jgi:hypothetical protein
MARLTLKESTEGLAVRFLILMARQCGALDDCAGRVRGGYVEDNRLRCR